MVYYLRSAAGRSDQLLAITWAVVIAPSRPPVLAGTGQLVRHIGSNKQLISYYNETK